MATVALAMAALFVTCAFAILGHARWTTVFARCSSSSWARNRFNTISAPARVIRCETKKGEPGRLSLVGGSSDVSRGLSGWY
jgi:hypothetical protein